MSRKEVWCSKKRDGRMSVFQPEDEGYSVSEIRRGLCLLPNILHWQMLAFFFCYSIIGGQLLMAPVVSEDMVSIGVVSNRPGETGRGLLSNFINYMIVPFFVYFCRSTDFMAKRWYYHKAYDVCHSLVLRFVTSLHYHLPLGKAWRDWALISFDPSNLCRWGGAISVQGGVRRHRETVICNCTASTTR